MSTAGLRDLTPPGTKVVTTPPAPPSARRSILTDSDDCLTSTSLPSSIHLFLPSSSPVPATHLALTFQGGFVGTSATIYVGPTPSAAESQIGLGLMIGGKIHPEDKNARQVFEIPYPPTIPPPSFQGAETTLLEVKIEFEASSDSHGRITVYRVELLG